MDIKVKKKKIKVLCRENFKNIHFFLKQSLKENLYPLSLKHNTLGSKITKSCVKEIRPVNQENR